MSMRVYFNKWADFRGEDWFKQSDADRTGNPGQSPALDDSDFKNCRLNGSLMRYDLEIGQPYVEISNFDNTLPETLTTVAGAAVDTDPGMEWLLEVRIVTSWEGAQQPAIYTRRNTTEEAVITRRGGLVCLQLIAPDPVSAQKLYIKIRKGDIGDLEVTPLDR